MLEATRLPTRTRLIMSRVVAEPAATPPLASRCSRWSSKGIRRFYGGHRAVAKQADAWPLGDDAYDRMIGPWAPGGGRSVDSTPVEAPGDVAERRGRRAFNPLRIKKMHEST